MHVRATSLDLELAKPFRISRGIQTHARNLLIEIEHEGVTGLGEAAPDGGGYYGEKQETMLAALPYLEEAIGDDPFTIEDITDRLDKTFHHGHGALKAALDMALHDLVGKLVGQPVYRLLGIDSLRTPKTSFTIAIDTPDAMAEKARAAADTFPILKIKVGTPDDIAIIRAIRSVTDAVLRVDANAAWTPKEAVRRIEELAPFGVELIEQPVSAHDVEGLRFVREHSSLPIFADESCVTLHNVPRLAGVVDGINIKLAKCGGIRNAQKMIATAHALDMHVMLGCMIGSTLSIAPAAQLSPLVEFADLDGGLLLADDPFTGVGFERGKIVLSSSPGLGVERRR